MERSTQDGYITHRSKHEKEYHASNFMIIRVKHNPTILSLESLTWKELHKMVTSHTDQYTKRLSCINLHDHTHQAEPNHLGVGVINMERTTQDAYITHRSKHEKEYHASNFMIIRVKHNPTILALESLTWKDLHKMVTSHTDQYTKKLSCIKLHDHTHQA